MFAAIRHVANTKNPVLTRYYHSCKQFALDSGGDIKNHFVNIAKEIQSNGCAILKLPDTTPTTLQEISTAFGKIQQNKNTDNFGITTVAHNDAPQKTAVVKSNLEFLPHTDGSYLSGISMFSGNIHKITPPKIVILQCVKPSKEGGFTTLIDSKRLLSTMIEKEPDLIPVLFSPKCAGFTRGDSVLETSVFTRLSKNSYAIRFSFDADLYVPSWAYDVIVRFYNHYIQSREFTIEKPLARGDILLVDNLRMLHGRTKFSDEREYRRVWIWDDAASCIMHNAPLATELHYASDDTKQKHFFHKYKDFEPLETKVSSQGSFPMGIHLPADLNDKLLKLIQEPEAPAKKLK